MKEYAFTWRVENYSYCWHKMKEELSSPVFTVGSMEGTAWTLSLCPRGHKNGNYISFFLSRSRDDDGPDSYALNYELSFLALDGSVLECRTIGEEEFSFERGDGYGAFEFAERTEVMIHNRDAYLPQCTLTARCRMWKGDGAVTETGQASARTRINVERVSLVQTMEGFSSLQPNQRKSLQIRSTTKRRPMATVNTFIPGGSCCEEKIMVEIAPVDSMKTIILTCKLHFLDAAGNRIECGQADTRFDSGARDVLNVPLIFSKRELLDQKSEYLPNDVLSLRCEFNFSTRLKFEVEQVGMKSQQTDYALHLMPALTPIVRGTHAFDGAPVPTDDIPGVLDDFKTLYLNQIRSDVDLKTKTGTFPAHKTVLCARSAVFWKMFTNDMKEKVNDYIEVEDLDDETVPRLLLFLYTDELEDLDWDIATKLYYAADKYNVQSLKVKCSSFLIGSLNLSNACEALLLADKHSDLHLKTVVEDFILRNDKEVFGSETWRLFAKTHPLLAVGTMCSKYGKY